MVNVLIVDDSPVVRRTLQIIVEAAGCIAAVAATGAEALSQAAQERPDIVLLDALLPDMTGTEILAGLRGLAGSEFTRVVVVSGLGPKETPGADGYIRKPFTPDQIIAVVQAGAPVAAGAGHATRVETASERTMSRQELSRAVHDLRTPLTAILAAAETLLLHDDAEIRQEFLEIIRDEALHIDGLLGLLDGSGAADRRGSA